MVCRVCEIMRKRITYKDYVCVQCWENVNFVNYRIDFEFLNSIMKNLIFDCKTNHLSEIYNL